MSRGIRLDYGDLYGSIVDDWELGFGAISVLRASMNLFVAVSAERNQILGSVVSKPAAEANVVDLKILRVPTVLASPAITFEYLRANSTICCRIEPASR